MVNYPVIYLIKVLSIMEYVPELGSDYLHPILTWEFGSHDVLSSCLARFHVWLWSSKVKSVSSPGWPDYPNLSIQHMIPFWNRSRRKRNKMWKGYDTTLHWSFLVSIAFNAMKFCFDFGWLCQLEITKVSIYEFSWFRITNFLFTRRLSARWTAQTWAWLFGWKIRFPKDKLPSASYLWTCASCCCEGVLWYPLSPSLSLQWGGPTYNWSYPRRPTSMWTYIKWNRAGVSLTIRDRECMARITGALAQLGYTGWPFRLRIWHVCVILTSTLNRSLLIFPSQGGVSQHPHSWLLAWRGQIGEVPSV